MAWLAEIDAQSRRLPWVPRIFYLWVKWTLVALGAYLLVGLYLERWGGAATVWLIGAPAFYGFCRGLSRSR